MTAITTILGDESDTLLNHACKGIPKNSLHIPESDFVDRVTTNNNRKQEAVRE